MVINDLHNVDKETYNDYYNIRKIILPGALV